MNRIATRAMIVLFLVLALAGGLVFFLGEYLTDGTDWVMFSGSPHIYTNGKIAAGSVTDRDGVLLVDLTDGRTYTSRENFRKATLHWVGDRQGNIRAPYLNHYTEELLGYDPIHGVYAYGNTNGTVKLTLSATVQAAALEAMGEHVGTVAVYNYKTGEILCAVSTPTYDPDDVPDIAGDTSGKYNGVYMNRFLQSKYIPGSIFKIVTVAAALDFAPEIAQERFTCTGKYMIDNGDVTCEYPHGNQGLKEAFANSCNCAFAQITHRIGAEKLARFVEQAGVMQSVSFDGLTSVEGNFEVAGATGEQIAWSGIGQHKDQINPCAFLTFVGAVANGGIGVNPYVVEQISVGKQITYRAETAKTDRILTKDTARLLQEYMANNVTVKYGAENFPGMTVCAKSGTGEVGGGKSPNAMFAGFLTDPEYPLAFIAAVEDGGYGARTCMPILSKVLQACIQAMDAF